MIKLNCTGNGSTFGSSSLMAGRNNYDPPPPPPPSSIYKPPSSRSNLDAPRACGSSRIGLQNAAPGPKRRVICSNVQTMKCLSLELYQVNRSFVSSQIGISRSLRDFRVHRENPHIQAIGSGHHLCAVDPPPLLAMCVCVCVCGGGGGGGDAPTRKDRDQVSGIFLSTRY